MLPVTGLLTIIVAIAGVPYDDTRNPPQLVAIAIRVPYLPDVPNPDIFHTNTRHTHCTQRVCADRALPYMHLALDCVHCMA